MATKVFHKLQRLDHAWLSLSPIKNLFLSFKQVLPLVIIDTYWRLFSKLFLAPDAFFTTVLFRYHSKALRTPFLTQGITNILDYLVVTFVVAIWTKKYLGEHLDNDRDTLLPVTVNFGLVLMQAFLTVSNQGQLTLHMGLALLIAYLVNLSYLGLTKITKNHLPDMGFGYLIWAALISIAVTYLHANMPFILSQGTYTTFFSSDFFAHFYSLAIVAVLTPILFVLGISIPLDLTTGATDLAQVNANLNSVYQSVMATLPQPQNIYSVITSSALIGGVGATLALALLLLLSRNKENRRIGLWTLIPTLFDNNQIMAYGLPLFFRPLTLVPMILSSLWGSLAASVAIKVGFIRPVVFSVPNGSPHLLLGFLASQTPWRSLLVSFIVLLGAICIYWPFVKSLLAQEENHG
ncbi:PTS sugar transporter subunit IIC [Fructobacillus ficulneus]|uniref:Cellobiose-specific PTS system IIC component n=1 Tax=Fructobacillus ficulneus TaxID=157463 RepID=A0A0K8MFL4_9LACO|nr:PTS sugar transporter subunit IIC [Fructobacillus ficulneus]GAO99331.1 cellobiose-specific PTS system IIC component [Fructobacillus ficulneus]